MFLRTFFDVIYLVEISAVFPRTFFDVISLVEKSMLFPLTFFDVTLMVAKSKLFASSFFDKISMGKNSTLCLFKLQAYEKQSKGFSFVTNFKKLTFARQFSLYFSSKSPWCRPVPSKFDSYNLQVCFLGIYRTNNQKMFGRLHCYEVTLVKMCNKLLLQKVKKRFSTKKDLKKNCSKSARKIILAFWA